MPKKAKPSRVAAEPMRLFDNPKQLLTVKQVAEALHVSIYTVYRKIQAGELEARRVGDDGAIRVFAGTVEAYMRPTCR